MPNKRVHCWTLHLFVVWCVRKYEKDRTGDQQLACFWTLPMNNCVGKEKEISRPACCSLTLLHIIYLLLHLIVLHVSAKSWNIATAKLDIFGFYLRILLSFRLFLIRLFGLLADFITEIVCIHYLLLFYYDTQINVVKLPFAIDPQPDSWIASQLHRWRNSWGNKRTIGAKKSRSVWPHSQSGIYSTNTRTCIFIINRRKDDFGCVCVFFPQFNQHTEKKMSSDSRQRTSFHWKSNRMVLSVTTVLQGELNSFQPSYQM